MPKVNKVVPYSPDETRAIISFLESKLATCQKTVSDMRQADVISISDAWANSMRYWQGNVKCIKWLLYLARLHEGRINGGKSPGSD